MPKTTYLNNKLLDHVLGNTAYTAPTSTLYFELYTANPGVGGGGTACTGGSYARATLPQALGATGWTTASGSSKNNSAAITWVTATASWGTVTAVGIFDAATTGNLLYYAILGSSKFVDTNDTVSIPAGNLVVTES